MASSNRVAPIWILLFGSCVALCILTACVVVPISGQETVKEFIPKSQLEHLERGKSNQPEIIAHFGEPDLVYKSPTRWVYETRHLYPPQYLWCVAFAAGFHGGIGCDTTTPALWIEYLYLLFDERGILADYSREAIKENECLDVGICPWQTNPTSVYDGVSRRSGLYYDASTGQRYTGIQQTFYANNQLAEELSFRDGFEDGTHRKWTLRGVLVFRSSYSRGLNHGLEEAWYDDGQPVYRFPYFDGQLHGTVTVWNSEGQSESQCFQLGKLVEGTGGECESNDR